MARLIASPMPMPCGLVVWNASNSRSRLVGLSPGPESATVISTVSAAAGMEVIVSSRGAWSPPIIASMAFIIADGHRAGEIIGRIRALAKNAPPRKDRLDVNATILEVIALARSEVHGNGVALHTRLAERLAPVRGDRVQLQQVILNLMINAIEAMSAAGAAPRELSITSTNHDSHSVLVAVRDSGPGLNPESLGRLFQAFYTTKPHGMGMGLAISRSIVEAHGGRLWAVANEAHGAVFQFTLPIGSETPA